MKMRTFILATIVMFGLCWASTSDAQTTVRGQLLRNGQNPAAGIKVTLNHPQYGRSSATMTGNDGMYYLYNVPYGDYYLELWISNPPIVYQVRVAGSPFSDLPRFSVP
jgi:hypothetical protein